MDKHKLNLPVTILLGCVILGGFYYASEVSKQGSIERQQLIDLQTKKAQQDDLNQKEENRKSALDSCLSIAQEEYDKNTKNVPPTAVMIIGPHANILKNEQDTCINEYK